MRLAVLASESPGRLDAIREYSVSLVEALRVRPEVEADLLLRGDDGRWTKRGPESQSFEERSQLADRDAVVVQYNPFLWGRWGFAPWLPATVAGMRRAAARPTIALMVHEPYVPMTDWRTTAMGLWQRLQLFTLRANADLVFASIEAWAEGFRRSLPRRPVYHLPVGSNFPDESASRAEERSRLGLDSDTVVLAALGTGHPSRLMEYVAASGNAVARERGRCVVFNLGAGAPPLGDLGPRVELHEPGALPAVQLARRLAAADVFLAPFVDGVSTRRGSLMAALQHGLPVVGTEGRLTCGALRGAPSALRLVAVDRADLFVESALRLARRAEERRTLGDAARELYARCFDWPVVAERMLSVLRSCR
jgi:glycosyltransferase involved in cell wall biosynthesis